MQLIAMDEIESLAEGRTVIRRSFDLLTYEPKEAEAWAQGYQAFSGIMNMARYDSEGCER